MNPEYLKKSPNPVSYILVSDKGSKLIARGEYVNMLRLTNLIRRGGGAVTIFKSTKG